MNWGRQESKNKVKSRTKPLKCRQWLACSRFLCHVVQESQLGGGGDRRNIGWGRNRGSLWGRAVISRNLLFLLIIDICLQNV